MLGQPPGAPYPGYPPPGGGEGVVGKGGRVADQPWGQRPGWAGPGSDDTPPLTLSHPGLSSSPGCHPEIQPSGPQDLQRGG